MCMKMKMRMLHSFAAMAKQKKAPSDPMSACSAPRLEFPFRVATYVKDILLQSTKTETELLINRVCQLTTLVITTY